MAQSALEGEENQLTDDLWDSFQVLTKRTSDVDRSFSATLKELSSCRGSLEETARNANLLKREKHQLQSLVTALQKIITDKCDFQEENRNLNQVLETMKVDMERKNAQLDALAKERDGKVAEMASERAAILESHAKQLDNINTSHRNILDEEHTKNAELLEQKERELAEMRRSREEADKEQMAEAVHLRMEHDAKLLKLQATINRLQMAQNNYASGHTSNSGIFRKKLDHMKAQHQTAICELQAKLSEAAAKIAKLEGEDGGRGGRNAAAGELTFHNHQPPASKRTRSGMSAAAGMIAHF